MVTELVIQSTPITPAVELSIDRSVFRILGRSMPENSEAFYTRIRDWVDCHLDGYTANVTFEITLEYYNTSSFIRLMELFNRLTDLNRAGGNITVVWFYDEDDQDTYHDGLSFQEVVSIPFHIRSNNG